MSPGTPGQDSHRLPSVPRRTPLTRNTSPVVVYLLGLRRRPDRRESPVLPKELRPYQTDGVTGVTDRVTRESTNRQPSQLTVPGQLRLSLVDQQ